MERIKLNLIPSGVAPVVHLSQYDEGRKFGIDLFEGDSVYVLDGTETLTVNSRKPDGHVVVISVTNAGSSSLEVETVEQLTAVHGTSYAKLKIEKGSDVIATLEFLIAVSRDPLENGDPSESFVDNLNTQIAQAVSEQYDSNNVIFDPAPVVGHGTGFAVTSEGVKTAIDNAIGGLSIPEDLNDLDDVDTTTPTQGEALVWDGTKWVNGTVSTVGNLDDLSDVDTTGKQEGDSLRYIGNEWKAKPTTVEMTQAEYDAIVDFTPYANTHIVITDAPNLNATASDIEYSSGVSVADKLTSLDTGKQDKETHANESPFEFYKIGHIVVCHIDTGNINFKSDNKTIDATIPSAYRPSAISYYITKVYNGSYVECSVRFNTNGTVLITDTGNSAIPNIQANYLQQQYFTYFTA